eukprot:COSAG06_NODE_2857_length_6168_cov_7.760092_4_plen_1024_part_00
MARTLTRALSLVLGHGAFFSIESVAETAESFHATKAEMEALAYDDSLVITAASEINGKQIIVGSRITHINGEFVQSSRELHPSQATAPPGAAVDNLIQLDFMLPAASELAVCIREMGEEVEEMEAELRAANDRASKAEDALELEKELFENLRQMGEELYEEIDALQNELSRLRKSDLVALEPEPEDPGALHRNASKTRYIELAQAMADERALGGESDDDLQEEEDASPNRKQRRTDRKRQRNEKEGKKVLIETQADWQRTKTRVLARRLKDHGHYAPLVAEVTLRLQQKIGGTVKTDSDSIRLIKSGIVDEIIRALGRHAADPDVQGNASQLLLTLMSYRKEAESSIEKSMAKHGPAAARELLLAIEDESSDANLVAANCSTLSILCRRGPCAVLDAIGDSATRGVDVLADAMRSHRGDERVQLSACQIFRVMCRDHTHDRARAVRNVGALDLALDAVRQHYADPEIAQEAQGLILCVPGDDYHRDRPALAMPVAGQPAKESRSQKKRSKRSKQKVGFVQSTDLYRFRSDSGPTKTKNGCVFVGERSLIFYSSDPRLRDCGQDSQAILAEVMYMQLEEFMVEKKQDKKETQEGKQWFELRFQRSKSRVPDLKIRTYEHQGQTFKDLVHQKRLALQRKVADVREESRRQKNRELFQLVQDLDRATAASAADHARKKAEIQASIQAKQHELEQTRYEQEEFRRGLEGQLAATHAVVEDQTYQMQAELNHKQLQATEEVEGLMRQLEENRLRAQQEERDLLAKERENRDRIRATAAAEAKQREEDAASRKQSVEITTEQIKRLKLSDGAITTQLVSIGVDVGDIIVGSHILSINGKPVQSQCEIDAVLAETDDGQDSEPEYLEAVAAMDLEELVEECDLEDVKWEHLDDEDSIRAALIAHSVGPSAAGGGAVAQAMHKVALEIPRSTTLAEQGRTCVVCFDDEIKRVDGYECDGDDRHFICDECLAGHVKAKMQEDMAHLEAAVSTCICCGCNHLLPLLLLRASKLSSGAFDLTGRESLLPMQDTR